MCKKFSLSLVLILFIPLTSFARVKILTFDGGGIRGVASLEIIKKLESDTKIQIHKKFDIFAGTSTGSIIAITLAMGIPIQEMIDNYEEMSSDVFGHKTLFSLFQPKYDPKRLKNNLVKVFKKHGYSESIKLGDLPKKIVIPIVRLDDPKTNRWGMGVLENITEQGKKVPVIDAILESTAAPSYFPSFHGAVDGGMAAKDPALAAYTYAYHPYNIDQEGAIILSIGTGYTFDHIENDEDWGIAQWVSPVSQKMTAQTPPILAMTMDTEDQMPQQVLSILLPDTYWKIDFSLKSSMSLDDYKGMGKLIKETDDYIISHAPFWNQTIYWLERQFYKSECNAW